MRKVLIVMAERFNVDGITGGHLLPEKRRLLCGEAKNRVQPKIGIVMTSKGEYLHYQVDTSRAFNPELISLEI